MKTLLAAGALCALLTSPALAYFPGQIVQPCDNVPPKSARQPVSVQTRIYDTSNADMLDIMGADPALPDQLYGLSMPLIVAGGLHTLHGTVLDLNDPAVKAAKIWVIYLNEEMTAKERACTLLYEKAHLPPNNWADYAIEGWVDKLPRGKR